MHYKYVLTELYLYSNVANGAEVKGSSFQLKTSKAELKEVMNHVITQFER